jgi:hypothetical protein
MRRSTAIFVGVVPVFSGCTDSPILDLDAVDSCDQLVDYAIDSAIQFRDETADLTLTQINNGESTFLDSMDGYGEQTGSAIERVADLGCDEAVLRGEYLDRLFELPGKSAGGHSAIGLAMQTHPFGLPPPGQ